jgi:SAM-dependent methyltransferase
LVREHGLGEHSTVADVGSGTGIFARALLATGARVFAVEPNEAMRRAAECALSTEPRFMSINGSAEATTLPDASVDLVTVAQAFHWFDRPRTRKELERILRPPKRLALVWNMRKSTPFLDAYNRMLDSHAIDYREVKAQVDEAAIVAFFGGAGPTEARFDHRQILDWEGLHGRLLSSSYVPRPGHPRHEVLVRKLEAIFAEHAGDGTSPPSPERGRDPKTARVAFEYETRLFYGCLA